MPRSNSPKKKKINAILVMFLQILIFLKLNLFYILLLYPVAHWIISLKIRLIFPICLTKSI